MIAFLARLAFAPFTLLFDWADRHCAELESTALADAAECPEEVEPPEPEPDAQELVTEIVFDLAAERMAESGIDDLVLWEYEYQTRGQHR